jgi:hypothetical membrane protein
MTEKSFTTPGGGASNADAGPDRGTTTGATGALLACGMVAGPLFAVVATAQILTRDGFDLPRHAVSLLSNGALGWIQIANFEVSGLLFLAAAVGLRRALRLRRGGRWGPRLVGAFAVGLIAAGVFRADPMNGFPPGTPPGNPEHPTWHSNVHFTVATLAFLALIAACLVVARGFAAERNRGWAAYSAVTGVAFLGASVATFRAGQPRPGQPDLLRGGGVRLRMGLGARGMAAGTRRRTRLGMRMKRKWRTTTRKDLR